MSEFDVYLEQKRVGRLVTDDSGRLAYAYSDEWLAAPDGFPISVSLPLRPGLTHAPAAHAFFVNLLPEGPVRESVARRLGLSAENDEALLRALGGDCAGALSILPPGSVPSARSMAYERLAPEKVAQMARTNSVLAAIVGEHHVRLSLAGAQDKLPIRYDEDGRFWLPNEGAPSTHILKVPSRDFKHLPANEWLTTALARTVGLDVAELTLVTVDGIQVLLITRYDRVVAGDQIARLPQEDFCQALGYLPSQKYEDEGGPTFADAATLIREHSVVPLVDVQRLLRWQVFNVLAGNCDGHAKNLSFYRPKDGGLQLTPFYDLVCTRVFPQVSRLCAMAVGSERDPGQIAHKHWASLAETIGVGKKLVVGMVEEMARALPEAFERVAQAFQRDYGSSPALAAIRRRIAKQCRQSLALLHHTREAPK